MYRNKGAGCTHMQHTLSVQAACIALNHDLARLRLVVEDEAHITCHVASHLQETVPGVIRRPSITFHTSSASRI